jgi:hypothetical protein
MHSGLIPGLEAKIRLDNRFSIVHERHEKHTMKNIIAPISIIIISVIEKSRPGE